MKAHLPTLIAISALAYLLAVFLHEALGHGGACLALGGKAKELNAFFFDCDYAGMSALGVRLVAVAGPLVSFLTGLLGLRLLHGKIPPQARYFLWLLMSIGFMTASGYFLFSGVSGLGDWGTSRDGALYQLRPEWLWRTLITLLGAYTYWLTIRVSLRKIERFIGGGGPERVSQAQWLSLTSYLTGGMVSVLVGLLNPAGAFVVIFSAAAGSLGATSALAWETQLLNRHMPETEPLFELPSSPTWMVLGFTFTLAYAVILGPSLKF